MKFVNTHQVEEQRIAWLAEGLWESQPDDVKGICADTGMIQVSDPLGLEDLDDLPRGTSIYWRLLGRRGLRSGFSDYELENLLELVMSRDDGHISFSSPGMLAEAKRFARILNEELIALDGE